MPTYRDRETHEDQVKVKDNEFFNEVIGDNFKNKTTGAESVLSLIRQKLAKPIDSNDVNQRTNSVLEFFRQHYEETLKINPNGIKVDFIAAPGSKVRHIYGGVIVVVPSMSNNGSQILSAHLVVVETGTKLVPTTDTINGNVYTVANTATVTVTEETLAAVKATVESYYGESSKTVFVSAGFSYIPSETNLEDNIALIRVLENAASACYSRIQSLDFHRVEEQTQAIASAATDRQLRLIANFEEGVQNLTNTQGLPVRCDFLITNSLVPMQSQNQNHHQVDSLEFGTVSVFCTPVYIQPPGYYQGFNAVPMQTQHYINRIVIKDIKTGPDIRMTLGTALLLIGTTAVLSNNGIWKRSYRPDYSIGNNLDIRDIGAFGYEVPMLNADQKPGKLNTKGENFSPEDFENLMNLLFLQEVLYSIDIPDGDQMFGTFVAEATDVRARDLIVKTLDGLTSGRFSALYNVNEPMFIDRRERVTEGYYVDTTGNRKSLDNIDHLAILNLAGDDTRLVREYEQADPSTPEIVKLSLKQDVMAAATNNMSIKSYSTRLNINPNFIAALVQAMQQSGLYPELNTNFRNNNGVQRMSYNSFANMLVTPGQIPNVFNSQRNNHWGNYQSGAMNRPFHSWTL